MTRDEYWKAHVAKNSRLADEDSTVTLKVSVLKALMMEAFGKGEDHAMKYINATNDVTEKLRKIIGG